MQRKNQQLVLTAMCGMVITSLCAAATTAQQPRQGPPPPPPPGGGGPGGPGGGGNGGGGNGGGGNGGGGAAQGATPVAGLNAGQLARFQAGTREFRRRWNIDDGLGPVFNGRSCGECHSTPALGGAGDDLTRTRVTRFGRVTNGVFDELANLGGSLIQRRSIKEIDPACPIVGERVPAEANAVSFRITTPVFGAGLIEAIPVAQILSREDPDDRNRDGISGRANRVQNFETGAEEIGRFGWKGSVSTLHFFSGAALNGELGVTNPSFPNENLPQGRPIPAQWDRTPDAEDAGQSVEALTDFMKYLAPQPTRPATAASRRGETLFTTIGCAACHTPSMTTAGSDPALAGKTVRLFSDLLLHDMGAALGDGVAGISAGQATGREWRTAPLWGVAARPFWMHDGRARSLDEAIRIHGGEGEASAVRYRALNRADHDAVLEFLRTL